MKKNLHEIISSVEELPETWLYLPPGSWDLDTVGVFSKDSRDFDDWIPIEAVENGWVSVLDKASIEDVICYTKNQLERPTPNQFLEAIIFYYKNDAFMDF